jgi:hypothetical protein
LANSTKHAATHYAVSAVIPSLLLSLAQIFCSAPCSQTPSVCVPSLVTETKFYTHKFIPEQRIMFISTFLHKQFNFNLKLKQYIYTSSMAFKARLNTSLHSPSNSFKCAWADESVP